MANELQTAGAHGATVYDVVINSVGQWANTDTEEFEAFNPANWAYYAIVLAEQSSSSFFQGNFPTWITTPGQYTAQPYIQAGGSPAVGDLNTGFIPQSILWNGTSASFPDINTQGGGPVAINQNTGGTNNLAFVDPQGNGIGNATILIYLSTDWPDNPDNVQATSATAANGSWLWPCYVLHGTYVAVFALPGEYGPNASAAFTV